MIKLVGRHVETHQFSGTEDCRNGDIGRVTSFRNQDASNPGMIMSRVESEPPTIKEHLVPGAEIHGGGISRNPDVTEVTRAVARRDVHATRQGDCQMGEVSAYATTFVVPLRGGAVTSGMVIAEIDAAMSIIANRLCPLPATLDASKQRPCKVRELFGVAVATRQQERQSFTWQRANAPLLRGRTDLVR